MTENVFEMRMSQKNKLGIEELPADLGEALAEFEKDEYLQNVLGRATEKYIEAKKIGMGRLSCAGFRLGDQ